MIIAAAINAVLSVVFLLMVFGGQAAVPVQGRDGLIADAVPQSLMIALMSMLVPTLLTRRRVSAGRVAPLTATVRWPSNVAVRSLLVAVAAAAIAWLFHAVLLPPTGPTWSFATVALFKPGYGALLGAGISRLAVTWALADQS